MLMRTISDIPNEFRTGNTAGENIAGLASGVHRALAAKMGTVGDDAGLRLVQAGFRFHSSEIGLEMARSSVNLSGSFGVSPQLVEFAGGLLAATALAASVDLSAAALHRLCFGPVNPSDPGREADLYDFPNADSLPDSAREWLQETRAAPRSEVLKAVRDHFVHRHFPIDVTVFPGGSPPFAQQLEIAGQRRSVAVFLDESREFAIDRLVTVGLVMLGAAT
jgi:hypothetical protein